MNKAHQCAASDKIQSWSEINFRSARNRVKKLQKRIAKAFQVDDIKKVAYLQHRLIHSFYAKALAVKVVTSNRGKDTPGVDGVLWVNPEDKFNAIFSLRRRGYRPMPLRRVYIPKPNGKLRPLSIPTMKDRAMQTLYRFALDPIGRLTADPSSYAYLPDRGAKKAIVRLGDVLSDSPELVWVMKADIKACFDSISHKWIMEHIPMDKILLKKFLKCGYVNRSGFHPIDCGVPQGGSLSCSICNMALDGLETLLNDRPGLEVSLVRYADDIIIAAKSRALLVQAVIPLLTSFLSERGLTLSQEKTRILSTDNKVCFLGWEVYRQGNKIISEPSRTSVKMLIREVRILCKANDPESCKELCNKLLRKIGGWLNYYQGIAPLPALYGVEFEIISLINDLNGGDQLAENVHSYLKKISE